MSETQSILICTKPKDQNLNAAGSNLCLTVRGNELDIVQKVEYLGVYIDNSLDKKEHIKTASAKESKALEF